MKVELKLVTDADLENLMHWRMRPDITKNMNTDPQLTLEGQRKWLQKVNADSSQRQWVIWVDGTPVGNMNITDIDKVNSRCMWGYYVAEKNYRSMKLAMYLELNIYEFILEHLGLNKAYSESFVVNESIVLHDLCGAHRDGILRDHVQKNGTFYDVVVHSMTKADWLVKKKEISFERIEIEDKNQ